MDVQVLGPVAVSVEGRPIALGGGKPRALLAMLALNAGSTVSTERLIDGLWGEEPPAAATKLVQVYVSRLRKALGSSTDGAEIVTRRHGYELRVEPDAVDAGRFERLVAGGAAREGLALWRGPPLDDVADEPFAGVQIRRLEELRLGALELAIEHDLEEGRHREVVAELEALIAAEPLRERLHAQLMLALYRCGRQADALSAYRHARAALVDELGIEPGPALQRLQASILRHDPALDAPELVSRPLTDPAAAQLRLPIPRTRTVGREDDLARLRELLGNAGLVTLAGAGGIGKTRLAVELARAVHADYADGVRFVSLATTESAELVAATVATVMGVAPLPDEPALDGLVRLIGDKRMLVVLDNFEHVVDAAEVVSALLDACAGLRIVATSREPLRLSGEQLFVVDPLALPEPQDGLDLQSVQRAPAVQLFADRCRAHDVGFVLSEANAVSVAEICARLEGMPLAIELAAAHATLLAPEELIRRLDRALSVLIGGPRDAPPRQQTLRATLDWSHALLEQEERQAFARLAVFSGGCTLEAAESVADINLTAVEALLAKSLLVTAAQDGGEPRVRMLEPVRAYALERFEERPDAEDLRCRHCEYYVSLAERAEPALRGPEQMTWLRRLDADHANLRAAVRWSLREHRPELGLRLASALATHARGSYSEIHDWLEATLKAATNVEPQRQAKARVALGTVLGGGPAAIEHDREGLRLFRAVSDARGTAKALVSLSFDVDQAGNCHEAADLARHAVELARTTEDEWLIAYALGALVRQESPESFQATKHFGEQGVAGLRRLGDRIQLSHALSNFGYAALSAGDFRTATPALDEAVAVSEELEDARVIPFNLVNRGLGHILQGEDGPAAGDFARALALCRESGQALPVAEALTGLAAIAVRRGDTELASRLSGASDAHRLFDAVTVPELRLQQQVIDPVRARRAEADWARGWTAGNALTFDQALALGVDAATVREGAA